MLNTLNSLNVCSSFYSSLLCAANIHATGVRKYPNPIGWTAAMPVEDRADVGSFWSGYKKEEPNLKRPRRVDETIGNQAGELYSHIDSAPLFI